LLTTGLPLGEGLDDTFSFLVESRVYALVCFDSGDRSITLYNEAYHDLTLNTIIDSALGVIDVLSEVLEQSFHTTWELGLLLYYLEDRLVYFFVDLYILRPEGDIRGRKRLILVYGDEGRLDDLFVVTYDLQFVRELYFSLLSLLRFGLRLIRLLLVLDIHYILDILGVECLLLCLSLCDSTAPLQADEYYRESNQ
jgi:hypothetical protein